MTLYGSSSTSISPVSSDQSSVEDLSKNGMFVRTAGQPLKLTMNIQGGEPFNSRHILKEREQNNPAMMDHSYSKLWYTQHFASKTMPTKAIYFNYPNCYSNKFNVEDAILDVEYSGPPAVVSYDSMKSRLVMGECERYVKSALAGNEDDSSNEDENDDWDDRIVKTNWSLSQNRVFSRATRIMHADRLARLTHEKAANEPVMRRIAIDKSAKRFRQLFGSINWDKDLTQWLHTILMGHLSAAYLAAYLDILQVLKSKIPVLMENVTAIPSMSKAVVSTGSSTISSVNESLTQLLKRPWDPTPVTYTQKLKKLPSTPLIVIAPFGPSPSAVNQLRRMRFWNSQFASLGKIIPVTMHCTNGGRNQQIDECLENMLNVTRNKVAELRENFPNRMIVLVGWAIGALVACHVALSDRLAAVVCLGFPSIGIGGSRGELDDPLLDIKTPILFVLGQMSTLCNIDDFEDMREKMSVETGLIVVGGADDLLRVSHKKKRMEEVTQSMVDRHIMEEINNFLTNVLAGYVPEPPCGMVRGASSFAPLHSIPVVKEAHKPSRKRKSTILDDNNELVDVVATSSQLKLGETKKEFQQVGHSLNPDRLMQQSPLVGLLTPPVQDASDNYYGRRNYGSGRAGTSTKKPKFNPIVTPIESSSSTSDSSNNSTPGGGLLANFDNTHSQLEQSAIDAPEALPEKLDSSGGIMVNIGALSSLGQLRTTITHSQPKFTSTTMTSLVKKSSPPKCAPPPIDLNPTTQGGQSLTSAFTRSLPITVNGVPVRSAFSVPMTAVGQSTLSSIMTYALESKGSYISTAPSTSSSTSSLLFKSKAGTSDSIRQSGRFILCKASSADNNDDTFLDQVQAIQKLQFHDLSLTTTSQTNTPGSPTITQTKTLSSHTFDLKRLQTLSTPLAVQFAGSRSAATSTTSLSSSTSTLPSLLIATSGDGSKPIFVSGRAASLAKMCRTIAAETTSKDDANIAAAQSVVQHALRTNPSLNFTVSSVKLHIPERRSSPSSDNASSALPKVSLIMLSGSSPKATKIHEPKETISVEENELAANESAAALLLDLARSAPAAGSSWEQAESVQPVSSVPTIAVNIPSDRLVGTGIEAQSSETTPEVPIDENIETIPIRKLVPAQQNEETKETNSEIIVIDSDSDETESVATEVADNQQPEKQTQSADCKDPAPATPSAKSSGSRSKQPSFPTIAATRTRRVRVPKYMYYEV